MLQKSAVVKGSLADISTNTFLSVHIMTKGIQAGALKDVDNVVFEAIKNETNRQQTHIELIASENFVIPAVMEAMGSTLTNK